MSHPSRPRSHDVWRQRLLPALQEPQPREQPLEKAPWQGTVAGDGGPPPGPEGGLQPIATKKLGPSVVCSRGHACASSLNELERVEPPDESKAQPPPGLQRGRP